MILGITRDSILAEQQFQQELAAMVEKAMAHKVEQLDAAIWDYIRDRMISPSDCMLIYVAGNPLPVSIVAEGYPAQALHL